MCSTLGCSSRSQRCTVHAVCIYGNCTNTARWCNRTRCNKHKSDPCPDKNRSDIGFTGGGARDSARQKPGKGRAIRYRTSGAGSRMQKAKVSGAVVHRRTAATKSLAVPTRALTNDLITTFETTATNSHVTSYPKIVTSKVAHKPRQFKSVGVKADGAVGADQDSILVPHHSRATSTILATPVALIGRRRNRSNDLTPEGASSGGRGTKDLSTTTTQSDHRDTGTDTALHYYDHTHSSPHTTNTQTPVRSIAEGKRMLLPSALV